MAEKQTDPNFENAKPEGAAGAANGNVRPAKDDALTTGADDFSQGNDETPLEPDYELFESDFFDVEESEEDGFYTGDLALLSGDLEGYLLDEFGWPVEGQRPFRTNPPHKADDKPEKRPPDRLVTTLTAQAAAARHDSQAVVLMGATVPLLAQKYAAHEATLRPILPALINLVANTARRLHRRPDARQAITQLPQTIDRTIEFLLRYVSARPRLTPTLAARVLRQQLAAQMPMATRRRRRSRSPNTLTGRQRHGRFYPESNDEWFDMDMWHDEDSF